MNQQKRIPIIIALICILQYANQGISGLPGQCIYYLTRETWGLSASMIGVIGWVVAVAWYFKMFFGFIVDSFNIKGKRTKPYLILGYVLLLLSYTYIVIFGLSIVSLIISSIIVNICIAFTDVIVDREMVVAENKYDLKGRLQSIQWTSLGIAGLVVALGGSFIASAISEPLNYKVAYMASALIPIAMLLYLVFKFKEDKVIERKKEVWSLLKSNFKGILDKKLLIGLLFIACLQFCPSFGTALMIKCREELMVSKMFLGYLGATGTVLSVVGYLLYYKVAYKFNLKKLLYFMVVFTAITNLFYLYIPNQWFLIVYNVAFGAFSGISFMVLLTFFVKIIPSGCEAFFYALVVSTSNFCGNLGSVFGGLIFDNFGYATTVVVSSVCTIFCLVLIPYLTLNEGE